MKIIDREKNKTEIQNILYEEIYPKYDAQCWRENFVCVFGKDRRTKLTLPSVRHIKERCLALVCSCD